MSRFNPLHVLSAAVTTTVKRSRLAKLALALIATAAWFQVAPEPLHGETKQHGAVTVTVTIEVTCLSPDTDSGSGAASGNDGASINGSASARLNGCTPEQLKEAAGKAGMKMFLRCGFSMDFVISEFYCIQLQEGGYHYMAGGRCG